MNTHQRQILRDVVAARGTLTAGEGKDLLDALDLAEREQQALQARLDLLLQNHEPWPVPDVLQDLSDAAEHLLRDHNCDTHGYEKWSECVGRARKYAAVLRGASVDTSEIAPRATENASPAVAARVLEDFRPRADNVKTVYRECETCGKVMVVPIESKTSECSRCLE